ncbi:MAG: hypothetical protein IPK24_00210 [Kineosporiaceae bacterium]|nr:hypothetical protein [Kineosporiaceae bacterium]MBK8073997.1 hypothetical protein [Kineosporiaceae bacterium]
MTTADLDRAGTTSSGDHPDAPTPQSSPAVPVNGVTPRLVTALQSATGHPCVSLLLSTTPAARMLREDAARLHGLLREAERRLVEVEALPGVRSTVVNPLRDLVESACRGPATQALAVFASAAVHSVVQLDLPVVERVVVDPTFATRDLVRALHRTPRHVVLALSAHEARLFDGIGARLHPAQTRAFPVATAEHDERGRGRGGRRSGRRPTGPEARKAFLRQVDRALGAYLRIQPAPLVLVGTERVVADFRRMSVNLGRLAGWVPGSLVTSPTTELVPRIRVVLEQYLVSRHQEAIELLHRRAGEGRVASGIQAAWRAAHAERPEMLVVEESYVHPARLGPDDTVIDPEPHGLDAPDVIDDLVDELIEAVLRRGGWVAFAEDDALQAHGRVALSLRP